MKKQTQNLSIALGLIILLLVLGIAWQARQKSPGPETKNQAKVPVPEAITSQPKLDMLTQSQLIQELPKGLPTEASVQTLQAFKATDSAGKIKVVRTQTTAKSPSDNLKLYQDYFKSSGWQVSETVDTPTLKSLSATKSNQSLKVSFSQDGGSKSNVVVVVYSY